MNSRQYRRGGLRLNHYPGMAHEIKYIYTEIFQHHDYLPSCFKLPESPCVIDAGANIGLFSLYMCHHFKFCQLISVEPSPDLFVFLKQNVLAHKTSQHDVCFSNTALSNQLGTADFYSYPKLPANSTLDPEFKQQELSHVESFINFKSLWSLNKMLALIYGLAMPFKSSIHRYAQRYVQNKLSYCDVKKISLTTVSALIYQHQLTRVDLLKVDVEGHELEVLQGVDSEHWPLIKNIALELSSLRFPPTKNKIKSLLLEHGFEINIKYNSDKTTAPIYMMYAFS